MDYFAKSKYVYMNNNYVEGLFVFMKIYNIAISHIGIQIHLLIILYKGNKKCIKIIIY